MFMSNKINLNHYGITFTNRGLIGIHGHSTIVIVARTDETHVFSFKTLKD